MEYYIGDRITPEQSQIIIQRNIADRVTEQLVNMERNGFLYSGDIGPLGAAITKISFEAVVDFVRDILEKWDYQAGLGNEYNPIEVYYVDKVLTYIQKNGIGDFLTSYNGPHDNISELFGSLQSHRNRYPYNLGNDAK